MQSLKLGGALALCSTLVLPLAAQNPPSPQMVTVPVDTFRGSNLDIPQPPKAVLNEMPQGKMPEVPVADSGLPQPNSAPVVEGRLDQQNPQTGVFTFFRNTDQRPSGRTQFHPGEPSTAHNRDTYFGTGNTYGSRSNDSGMTWTLVNPFTLFPASDGGVCCDQRVIYDAGADLTIWYIQYRYSSTTQNGGGRIAWAQGRDGLRNSSWTSAYFSAASFGLTNNWLDFPDIAVSGNYLYLTSNVFNSASSYTNSVVYRIALADLTDGGGVTAFYYRRTGGTGPMGGGASYRFTQTYNGAPNSTMFWASHNSTSSIRIFSWQDANGARDADVDQGIAAWTSGSGSSPGPDGRDWIGGDDHRIGSGYVFGTEGGFLWSSNSNGGSRPQSYVRVCRFTPATRAIIANDDVWNPSTDFAYPACGVNSQGHKGVVMSRGSPTAHVATYAFLVDNYAPNWFGQTVFTVTSGTNGAPSNRWGDYHSVVANRINTSTFVGTAMHMSGGTATANTVHEMVWFGRDDYTPTWVDLNVSSTPVSGVSITVDETDRNGNKNGVTPFTRSYTPRQGYTLRAPTSHTSGSNTYLFVNWTGTGGTSTNPIYTVSDILLAADTATANYSLQTIITVNDRNVSGGVPITVGTVDLNGAGNGTTLFTRRYKVGDGPFAFTAPSFAGLQPFNRWYVNGAAQPLGQRTISVSPTTNAMTIEADYCIHTSGGFRSFGAGCRGSSGAVPVHSATVSGGTPERGEIVRYNVSSAATNTSAALFLGFSNTVWNGVPLPLNLGFIGADPSCNILVEGFVVLPFTTDGTGFGFKNIQTSSASAIGTRIYTQTVSVDFGVPAPLKIVVSNGLETTLGGDACR